MNILFDINHPVDINFFKHAISKIDENKQHRIVVTYRDRGKLSRIIKHELKDFSPIHFGYHKQGFWNKIFGQLYRDYLMIKFQKKMDIDVCVCFGSTAAISSWINKIPYIAFDDDFEYKIPFYHANYFSNAHVMPEFIEFSNSRTYKYKGFKELAYLHPQYFNNKEYLLTDYNIQKNNYVFIREVASISLNYKKVNNSLVDIISKIQSMNLDIILSLEDDKLKDQFKNDCIILEEPVEDIFSIINNSLFSISSGDTMARESCLLGIPCIYTGGRNMNVNKELINIGVMFKEDSTKNIINRIDFLSNNKINDNIRKTIEKKIIHEWDNTTEIILQYINKYIEK